MCCIVFDLLNAVHSVAGPNIVNTCILKDCSSIAINILQMIVVKIQMSLH